MLRDNLEIKKRQLKLHKENLLGILVSYLKQYLVTIQPLVKFINYCRHINLELPFQVVEIDRKD